MECEEPVQVRVSYDSSQGIIEVFKLDLVGAQEIRWDKGEM
jgi:hypothetical protein